MIKFTTVSSIFSDFIEGAKQENDYENEIKKLIYSLIKINKVIWDLEDSARLSELGDRHVSDAKKNIDTNNQQRNNLIREIDVFLYKSLNITSGNPENFYSESPGMILDRLSIIFIKRSVVKKIISLIKEDDLKFEYLEKEKTLQGQIKNIGNFFDGYIQKLENKEIFFKVQEPVKIYNDSRVREYIQSLE